MVLYNVTLSMFYIVFNNLYLMNIVKRPLYCDGHRFVVQEGNLVDKTGRYH